MEHSIEEIQIRFNNYLVSTTKNAYTLTCFTEMYWNLFEQVMKDMGLDDEDYVAIHKNAEIIGFFPRHIKLKDDIFYDISDLFIYGGNIEPLFTTECLYHKQEGLFVIDDIKVHSVYKTIEEGIQNMKNIELKGVKK